MSERCPVSYRFFDDFHANLERQNMELDMVFMDRITCWPFHRILHSCDTSGFILQSLGTILEAGGAPAAGLAPLWEDLEGPGSGHRIPWVWIDFQAGVQNPEGTDFGWLALAFWGLK